MYIVRYTFTSKIIYNPTKAICQEKHVRFHIYRLVNGKIVNMFKYFNNHANIPNAHTKKPYALRFPVSYSFIL